MDSLPRGSVKWKCYFCGWINWTLVAMPRIVGGKGQCRNKECRKFRILSLDES